MTASEVRSIRDARGLSRVELATLLGVAPSTVSRWESGKCVPTEAHETALRRLARGAK